MNDSIGKAGIRLASPLRWYLACLRALVVVPSSVPSVVRARVRDPASPVCHGLPAVRRFRRIGLTLGVAVLAALAAGCGERTVPADELPWHIEPLPGGTSRVLGITLGETTLAAARSRLSTAPEVALFAARDDRPSLEAYFGSVELGGIVARLVLRLEAEPGELAAMRERAGPGQGGPTGARRYRLAEADLRAAASRAVTGITYAPAYARLDDETLRARFGEPAETLAPAEDRSLWLYPALGLAVVRDGANRAVLEYVAPRDFAAARERLLSDRQRR